MAVPAREAAVAPSIHPTAFVAPTAVVVGSVTLGPRSSIWYHAVLRGDNAPIVVGEASNVQDGTIIHVDDGKPAIIGAQVGIGHRAILHGCTVEDECLIGMGSVLLNDVRIGTGSVVAAGAVLPEGMEVPPGSVVMGVPARVARPVDEALRARIRATWEHYLTAAERHRAGAFPRLRAGL